MAEESVAAFCEQLGVKYAAKESEPQKKPSEKAKSVKLNKEPLYVSATALAYSSNKSGKVFLWSEEVVNGRVRITIAEKYVGVAGMVTGWVDAKVFDQKETVAAPQAGQKLTLVLCPLYISSTATKKSATKTGTYYLYDGEKVNGRYRITNSKANVGKAVTGWIDAKYVK